MNIEKIQIQILYLEEKLRSSFNHSNINHFYCRFIFIKVLRFRRVKIHESKWIFMYGWQEMSSSVRQRNFIRTH